MPFCTTCGASLQGDSRFCKTCGSDAPEVSAAAISPAVSSPVRRFGWRGNGGGLLKLYGIMFVLSALTLSLYSFWGRSHIRRYIARQTELDNERFDYHGTGKELLLGWLKAMGFLAALVLVCGALAFVLDETTGMVVTTLVVYAALLLAAPIAMVGAWRYRFSRTSYRGIRFSFRGDPVEFLKIFVAGSVLTVVTFSLYLPVFQNRIRRFLCEHTYYGTAKFGYDGPSRGLFGKWAIALLLAVPTIGLSLVWYWVERYRFYWRYTTFAGARLHANVRTPGMVWLFVSNFLLMVGTLFIGYTWAQARTLRYMLERLTLEGEVSFEDIQQQVILAGAGGEGLSMVVDTGGIDMGIGL